MLPVHETEVIPVLGDLLFEDLLQDGLCAFPDPDFHVALEILIESLVRAQVLASSLHSRTTFRRYLTTSKQTRNSFGQMCHLADVSRFLIF